MNYPLLYEAVGRRRRKRKKFCHKLRIFRHRSDLFSVFLWHHGEISQPFISVLLYFIISCTHGGCGTPKHDANNEIISKSEYFYGGQVNWPDRFLLLHLSDSRPRRIIIHLNLTHSLRSGAIKRHQFSAAFRYFQSDRKKQQQQH